MKLAAHIPFFYDPDRIHYLNVVINDLLKLPCEVCIYIYTNNYIKTKLTFYKQKNIKILYYCYFKYTKRISLLDYYLKRIGLKLLIHPYYLTWENRKIIKRNINKYDVQMYLEDDINFDVENFKYWLSNKDKLISLNYNLGFLRVETNGTDYYFSDLVREKPSNIVIIDNEKYLVNDNNTYCAFWIYDKNELKKFIQSKEWSFQFEGYGIREKSAIGWHGLNMKRYEMTLIPLIRKKNIIPKECTVKHLPNNYIGNDLFCTIKYPLQYDI